jgi:hypothetical protein
MKKQNLYKIYLTVLIFLQILNTTVTQDNRRLVYFDTNPIHQDNYIYTTKRNNTNIDLDQINKKIWAYHSNLTTLKFVSIKLVILVLLTFLILYSIKIDKRENIIRLQTIRFHGSKYKGWCLLPAF